MADIGRSNSVLGESAEKEEMVQSLEKTIMRKVNFIKRYHVNFKKDRGNFVGFNPSMKAPFFNRAS